MVNWEGGVLSVNEQQLQIADFLAQLIVPFVAGVWVGLSLSLSPSLPPSLPPSLTHTPSLPPSLLLFLHPSPPPLFLRCSVSSSYPSEVEYRHSRAHTRRLSVWQHDSYTQVRDPVQENMSTTIHLLSPSSPSFFFSSSSSLSSSFASASSCSFSGQLSSYEPLSREVLKNAMTSLDLLGLIMELEL